MGTLRAQKEAYESAMKENWEAMVDFYESGLNTMATMAPVTVARDSALHVAVDSKKAYPLNVLLRIIEESFPVDIESEPGISYPVFVVNAYGNTVLHQAATVGNYEAVKLLAEKFPDLAKKTNEIGETPLFRAASFGETKIVDYLANKVPGQIEGDGKLSSVHRKRSTGTSILHVAVQGEHFETALLLLDIDESLGRLRGKDRMTALHLLAKMPSAFESGYPIGVLTKLLYACLPVEEYISLSSVETERNKWRHFSYYLHINEEWIYLSICKFLFNGWPIMKKIWDDKKKHKFALKLANKLIEKDFSWEKFVEANFSTSSGFVITLSYDSREEQRQMGQSDSIDVEKKGIKSKDPLGKETRKEDEETKEDKETEEREEDKETKEEKEIKEVEEGDEKETKEENQIKEEDKKEEGDEDNIQNQLPPSQWVPQLGFRPQQAVEKSHDSKRAIDDKKHGKKTVKYTPIPLFIATENGIMEIVKKTLKEYPQAVEHIDGNGRNILHLAISHRRKEIFEYIVKHMRKPVARLKLGIDNNGYTLLHHAADTEHYIGGSTPGPALQLQEELQCFERVQDLVPSHYALHREKKEVLSDDKKGPEKKQKVTNRYTALELFKESHENQLRDAQQWVKDTSQSCSTVAVLVATVVFAAAYTVPGGSNEQGVPILSKSPYFLFFTVMDVISLACSLTSVVMFLSILTSPFELQEFRHSLPRKLTFGFTLLFFSVVTTMLTFGATILLTIHLEQKLTTSLLSTAAFFPVLVFALMQFRLYVAFMGTMKELVNDIAKALPSCFVPFLCCKDKLD